MISRTKKKPKGKGPRHSREDDCEKRVLCKRKWGGGNRKYRRPASGSSRESSLKQGNMKKKMGRKSAGNNIEGGGFCGHKSAGPNERERSQRPRPVGRGPSHGKGKGKGTEKKKGDLKKAVQGGRMEKTFNLFLGVKTNRQKLKRKELPLKEKWRKKGKSRFGG